MASYILKQIIAGREPCNTGNLPGLKKDELECTAILLGVSKSGTKALLVKRIANCYEIRIKIAAYKTKDDLIGYREIIEMEKRGEDMSFIFGPDAGIEQMVKDFSGKELRSMCRTVKCGVFGCKRQMAANLINWRNRCRTNGLKAWDEAMKEIRENPRQIQLELRLSMKGGC